MSIAPLVREIGSLAAAIDQSDLPGLVELQEKLELLLTMDDAAPVESLSETAIEHAGSIILREAEDEAAAFEALCAAVDGITAQIASDGPNALAEEDIDVELLEAWLSATVDHLAILESTAVGLEGPGDVDGELLAEARRIVHTIKGEAGFLSLELVRVACHKVESLIDARLQADLAFPGEELLALVDWLKRCLDALSRDALGGLPDAGLLLDQIRVAATRCNVVEQSALTEQADASGTSSAPPTSVAPTVAHVRLPMEASGAADETPPGNHAPVPHASFDDPAPVTYPDDLGMDENLGDFIGEAREHLTAAEDAVLILEQTPEEAEPLGTVFRAFHTVKGVAGFMNLVPIVELAHEAETLLDHARNGRITLDSDRLDCVLRACDMLESLVATLEGESAPTCGSLNKLVFELRQHLQDPPASQGSAAEAAVTGDAPNLARNAAAEPNRHPDSNANANISTGTPATPRPAADGSTIVEPSAAPAKLSATGQADENKARRARIESTVKVSTSRLDNLVTMVGELVIAQQMILQDPSIQSLDGQRVQRNLSQVSKIVRDLQGVSMALSMVPVKSTFQKMARLVRDTAVKGGKKIAFVMEGEDTELDRNVVEAIGDPLVHMIRNACDHGIESPDVRVAAGKSDTGSLCLSAFHQGGSIVIEIRDDGGGLNRERILKKAIERGLLPGDTDPSDLSDSEIDNLIFQPGFSTAEKITDISGRGVGMDVVRKNIEALRGKVEITSRPGEGSTFSMRLPLTMAIIDGMVVSVGDERFVLPTLAIEQSFRPTAKDLESTMGRGEMARVRGKLLPIHRLASIFDLTATTTDLTEGLLLVIESTDGRFCLSVDEIIGQQQVVIKSLGEGLPAIQGVAGGAILGDGRVALILDVMGLSYAARREAETPRTPALSGIES
ncbi:MAG: chemotaxis protein CheA [Phycisphaerales bacterium]